MNNSQIVIKTLVDKRDSLISEKTEMLYKFNSEISEIENALEELSGRKVWDLSKEELFDDNNPDYIKGSAEEM